MTQKKLFRTIGAFATALMIITLAGACNGLLPGDQPGDDGTANGGGGNVVINLSGLPAELTNRAVGQARGVVQFDFPRQYVNFYEVYFYRRAVGTTPASIVAKGESVRGESRLILNVPANETVTNDLDKYQILVLAGAYANGSSANGEKVLLASGYRRYVTVRAGVRNTFTVKMSEVKAAVDVWGVPKGTVMPTGLGNNTNDKLNVPYLLTTAPLYKYDFATGTTSSKAPLPMVKSAETGLNYVQLDKQEYPYNSLDGTILKNPWSQSTAGTSTHKLTIGVALTGLDPLLYAKAGPAGGTINAGNANSIFATNGHEARIVTLSPTQFPMNPITFKYEGPTTTTPPQNGDWATIGTETTGTTAPPIAPLNNTAVGVTQWQSVAAAGISGTDHTTITNSPTKDIMFLYTVNAWHTTTTGTLITNVPTSDAAGVFYFNYKYWPFGLESAGSVWNIRNRLLWSNGKYYGGGVVLLFGNAGTDWVEVVPTYP